jgi:hypothetical protein
MKVSLVSDLHLEFGYQELPGGELLILAGDICEYRSIDKDLKKPRKNNRTPGELRCWDFFEYECAKYEHVLYVLGNHENYHWHLDKTYNDIKSIIPANITVLENESIEIGGVLFVGATLWTDLNNNDPVTLMTVKHALNDYRAIKHQYADTGLYQKLIPEHTYHLHKDSLAYIQQTVKQNQNRPVVVITHYAPSHMSIHEKYRGDYHMNGGFVSDLSSVMLDNTHIDYWVHGHCHDPVDYVIGSTNVISNPRGYIGHEDTSQFNPNYYFEIHEHHS